MPFVQTLISLQLPDCICGLVTKARLMERHKANNIKTFDIKHPNGHVNHQLYEVEPVKSFIGLDERTIVLFFILSYLELGMLVPILTSTEDIVKMTSNRDRNRYCIPVFDLAE